MTKQELHTKVSYVKSVIRIVGYCFIPINLSIATVILVLSEAVGVAEEAIL